MKAIKFLFVLSIILGLAVSVQSQDKGKQVERPMKGSFYAVVVSTSDDGKVETLAITGNATHLGNLTGTMYFDKTNIIPNPTPQGIVLTGAKTSGTIIAANGDEIEFGPDDPGMVITGSGPLGPKGIMSGVITIISGTGRFTGCSGVFTTTGIFDMGNDYASWTAEGWIKY